MYDIVNSNNIENGTFRFVAQEAFFILFDHFGAYFFRQQKCSSIGVLWRRTHIEKEMKGNAEANLIFVQNSYFFGRRSS
jgi:hypothetical protein